MQLGSESHIPDGLLAAIALLSEKPRLGVPSRNPAPNLGLDERNCTMLLGLQFACSETVSGPVEDPYNGSYDLYNPQSFNRYAYVNGNPLAYTDPTGLAGAGVLTGVGGSACGAWRMDSMNPCSPLVSTVSLGIDQIFGLQKLSFAADSVTPILSFGITFGCGFASSSDAKSSFCGQSGWTALFSKDHPDLATGINDSIATVSLVDGLAVASAASTAGISSAAYLGSCFAGTITNPVCDVAIALVAYTALNDIFSIFWDAFGGGAQFTGSLLPRPQAFGGLGTSPIGIPNQNLSLRDLTNP